MRFVRPMLVVLAVVAPLLYLQSQLTESAVFLETPYFTPLDNDTAPQEAYPLASLDPSDRTTLINVTDFGYSIEPHEDRSCGSRRPLVLALIHSAPHNADRRARVRNTWLGNRTQDIVGLFLLGQVDDANLQRQLVRENDHYGDMLQGTFVDSYRNMTYKHTMSLKVAVYRCPGARYIVRVDDDVFVNVPFLTKLFQTISPFGARDLLMCKQKGLTTVWRSYRSKWRVSFQEYPSYSYPEYCSGGAVIYSPDVVFRLYKQVQRLPYFWIDDVHVTGTAAKAQGIRHNNFLPNVNPFTSFS